MGLLKPDCTHTNFKHPVAGEDALVKVDAYHN